jgi:hypothetical protein
MAFQILYAEESDAPSLAKINTLSFQGRGFLSQVFPETTQEGLQAYKSIYTMKHLANPQLHVLKVADPTCGTTVGYARWHIPESLYPRTNLPVLSEQAQEAARDFLQFTPRPMNEQLYGAFRGLLEECRKKHLTEKDMSKYSPPFSSSLHVARLYIGEVMINPDSAGSTGHATGLSRTWNWIDPLALGHSQGG